MKQKHTFRILLCLLIAYTGHSTSLLAQTSSDCAEIFIKAFNDFRAPTGDGYRMSYSMETISTSDVSNTELVEMRTNNGRAFLQTTANKMFKDDQAMVFIDDKRKLIFITKAGDESLKEARVGQMALMQDSLLHDGQSLSCQSVVSEEGQSFIKVSLNSDNKVLASLGFESLDYWINQETEQIEKISGKYQVGHPQLKAVTVSFSDYNKDFKGQAFSGEALAQIYDVEGNVQDAFAKYRVINNLID